MIPIDSTDAREQLERAADARDADERQEQLHQVLCSDGWLGDDPRGRPIPCPWCRPSAWPAVCSLCAMPAHLCERLNRRRRRRCCMTCDHPAIPDIETAIATRQEGPRV